MPLENSRPVSVSSVSSERTTRPRLAESLPSDRIAFARQVELLEAWATDGHSPMTNDAIARRVGLNASTVSLANPFFTNVGFLNRAIGGYVASPELLESGGNLINLAGLLAKTWFAKIVLSELPTDEQTGIDRLADAASLSSVRDRRSLLLLLDYLEAAGIIKRKGGQIQQGISAARSKRDRSASTAAGEVTVMTTFSHPDGRILELKAVFPVSQLQAGFAAHIETLREAVSRNFPANNLAKPGSNPRRVENSQPGEPLKPQITRSSASWSRDPWLAKSDAICLLNMSGRSLYYFVQDGKIRSQAGPAGRRFSREDIEKIVRMRQEARLTPRSSRKSPQPNP